MTRRERLEHKIEKRKEWADGRAEKAGALLARNEPYRGDIAFNTQPGHIPERARVIARSEKAWEHQKMAGHHRAKAAGLATQLDKTIFSDDPDAIDQLVAKVDNLKAQRDEAKRFNGWWRKHKTMKGCPNITDERATKMDAEIPARYAWERQPIPAYTLSNIGSEIRRAEKRIEAVKHRNERVADAEAAGGIVVKHLGASEGGGDYTLVTFAEKPARDVLAALRAAGYSWGAGSWVGPSERLPGCIKAMMPAPSTEAAGSPTLLP